MVKACEDGIKIMKINELLNEFKLKQIVYDEEK